MIAFSRMLIVCRRIIFFFSPPNVIPHLTRMLHNNIPVFCCFCCRLLLLLLLARCFSFFNLRARLLFVLHPLARSEWNYSAIYFTFFFAPSCCHLLGHDAISSKALSGNLIRFTDFNDWFSNAKWDGSLTLLSSWLYGMWEAKVFFSGCSDLWSGFSGVYHLRIMLSYYTKWMWSHDLPLQIRHRI